MDDETSVQWLCWNTEEVMWSDSHLADLFLPAVLSEGCRLTQRSLLAANAFGWP